MPINRIKLVENSTTVFEGHGQISYHEILEELLSFYNEYLTMHCIWDFTDADITTLSKSDLQKLIDKGREFSKRRIGGKTAWVAKDNITFGMCRMAQLLGTNKNTKLALNVFHSKAKAIRWISSKSSQKYRLINSFRNY